MASASLGKELDCSVCLSLYMNPVTLRCGHNFCRVCIDQHLNTQDGSGVYSCPLCRTEFRKRPALKRNITLCSVVENVRSTQPHQEETNIFCTYCVDSPVPAVKSCLMCEASLCDKHLNIHSKGPEHVLTEPRTSVENRKCFVHKELLKYYCTKDAKGGDEDTGGDDRGDQGVECISLTLSDIIRDVNVTFYGQDPADILLDVNTAANNLLISGDLKTVIWTQIDLNRPETTERFQGYQVMSSTGFSSGRHCWDVEISRSGKWRVGMCYPSIDRRTRQSYIGNNSKSWGLCGMWWNSNQCSVRHDSNKIDLPHQISSDRVRVYLDYEAGLLSFYELCDPIRHLHTFTAAFTEPLHAVLWVWGSCMKLSGSTCEEPSIEEICPETVDITGSRI